MPRRLNPSIDFEHLSQCIDRLVSGSAEPNRPLIAPAFNRGRIDRMADRLIGAIESSEKNGRPVCLCSRDKAWTTAALLASLRCGRPVILPHSYSRPSLKEAWQAFRFSAALVDGVYPLPDAVAALPIEGCESAKSRRRTSSPISPDRPWVYLFTGGSTGRPKIWSKTPVNLLSEILCMARAYSVTDRDRIVATVPPNHIYGLLYSVLLPLVSSAEVLRSTPSYPNEIDQAIADHAATILVSIPVHYRTLAHHPLAAHGLRLAFSSAGALDPQDDKAFYGNTGVPVTEIYGSTETGGIANRCRALGQPELKPFDWVEWRISRKRLRIRSAFLSAELERDPDGFFELADRVEPIGDTGFKLLGRIDGITKVAGKRVDLAGIREVLKTVPGVRDAVVFAMAVGQGRENEIMAMVEGAVSIETLRHAASNRLEPYARPRRIRVVDRLPFSEIGKLDRELVRSIFASPARENPDERDGKE
ncbi:MAG: AMP-binding protein [Desulfobacterales bacterium]